MFNLHIGHIFESFATDRCKVYRSARYMNIGSVAAKFAKTKYMQNCVSEYAKQEGVRQ